MNKIRLWVLGKMGAVDKDEFISVLNRHYDDIEASVANWRNSVCETQAVVTIAVSDAVDIIEQFKELVRESTELVEAGAEAKLKERE